MIETLRNHLLRYGVFVEWGRGHGKVSANLTDTLSQDVYHYWSSEEFDRWHEKDTIFRGHCQVGNFVANITIPPRKGDEIREEMEQLRQQSNSQSTTPVVPPLPPTRPNHTPAGGHPHELAPGRGVQVATPRLTPGGQRDQRDASGGGYRGRNGHRNDPDPVDRPSPKQLSDLSKPYSGNNMKYGGEKYDVLDVKLTIFRENCNNAGISSDASHLAVAFPFMSKGKAHDFYVQRLCTRVPRDFFILINAVRRQFETEETIKAYLAEWQQIFLSSG
ncbi:hypothetical protein CH35J_012880 [Colletotrichum higginsianum]|uniref:Uncharacterized protein n=1 Tax=Colletotrichum higginsianum TaxID=80884 RepID=A0A4T0VCS7_9PEZI|nr:hypothetical protein CH35J_012880 [Colletotrichum higginsianum]